MPNKYSLKSKIEREQELLKMNDVALKIQARKAVIDAEREQDTKIVKLRRRLRKQGIVPNNDKDIVSILINRCYHLAVSDIEQGASRVYVDRIAKFANKLANEVSGEYNYALEAVLEPLLRHSNDKADKSYNQAIKDCISRLKLS